MNYFDHLFYVNQYDDLSHFNEKQSYEHYVMFGRKEGRVCSKEMMLLKQEVINEKIQEQYKLLSKIYNKDCNNKEKKINILIRTSNRPTCFSNCLKSILKQKYSNYKIYICYDDVKSLDYLKEYKDNPIIEYFFIFNSSKERYKYNLYCNRLKSKVEDGYILYLDDDDELVHN